jgi:kumamolisin
MSKTRISLAVGLVMATICTAIAAVGIVRTRSVPIHEELVVARRLGPTSSHRRVEFSLVLRLHDRAGLERFLNDVQDPSSPHYREFLGPREFGARFGLSRTRLERLGHILSDRGLHITRSYPQRTSVKVAGIASRVERFFRVRLSDFRDRQGRRYHKPDVGPTIPSRLIADVRSVSGLNSQPPPPSAAADIVSSDGLRPQDVESAYDIGPLHDAGIDGSGVNVAVFTLYTYHPEDIDAFDQRYGLSSPDVERVPVNGGTSHPDSEDALDIETIRSVAPGAQILNYEAEGVGSFGELVGDIVDQVVAEGRTDIISMSYGICNSNKYVTAADRDRGEQALEAAAAQGINVFVATQDSGAYTCERIDPADHTIVTSWPGDSPWVVSVGGTLLSVRQDGSYLREAGWQDELSKGGGGGGLHPTEPRPDWQVGPGVDNEFSNGNRQVPDVSAAADPDSGFAVVSEGKVSPIGGTSASTPFWAGVTALLEQKAKKEGIDRIGFLNPILYQLGLSNDPPFHDVVLGGNRFHNATPGWDYSTGLGSPIVSKLVDQTIAYLKQNPPQ